MVNGHLCAKRVEGFVLCPYLILSSLLLNSPLPRRSFMAVSLLYCVRAPSLLHLGTVYCYCFCVGSSNASRVVFLYGLAWPIMVLGSFYRWAYTVLGNSNGESQLIGLGVLIVCGWFVAKTRPTSSPANRLPNPTTNATSPREDTPLERRHVLFKRSLRVGCFESARIKP